MFIGVFFIVAGAIYRAYQDNKERYKGKAIGTVVDIMAGTPDEEGMSAGVHDYFYPIIAYYANGLLFKERYRKGSNPCSFHLNQKLPIQYNLKRPDHFIIKAKGEVNHIATILYFAGLLFCASGGISFILYAMRIFIKKS